MNVPHLDEVRATLGRDDRPALEAALRPLVARGTPAAIREALRTTLSPWYTAGPQVGDETIDAWCWCHSFANAADPLQALFEQVQFARMWRRNIVAFLDSLADDALDRPEQVVLAVVEEVVSLGINDAWYANVHPVLAWTLDRFGIPRSPEQLERLYACCELRFTSWVAPGTDDRRAFADEVGWILVEQLLDGS